MCGIAGRINFSNKAIIESDIVVMTDKIAHRGPDDAGVYISNNRQVGLGNRRLAVIDLSEKGHQPMSYKNRYWITTNGEIYNFQNEKRKLIQSGYKFNSDCDTEVILALYDKYGVKCLDFLRGMFAFCIYDAKENTVFLARDRIGVKPLKYYQDDNCLIFSSELKAILTQPEVKKIPDYKAIQMYLAYGYVPAPLTGFLNINKLEPGNYIFIDLNTQKRKQVRYWEPIFKEKLKLSEKEWCDKILSTLEESTNLRMVSDVPVGAFLSGGVDSSAVVACMANLSKKPIKTFTISFKDADLNEALYAKKIADIYKTDHNEIMASPTSTDILPDLAYMYEEPFSDASNVVTHMVSKLARQHVTVVLNGDGGDENFAGYPNRYFRLKRDIDYNYWISNLRPLALSALKALEKVSAAGSISKGTKFLEKSKLPLYRKFMSYNQIFSSEEIINLTKGKLEEYDFSEIIYDPLIKCFDMFNGRDLKDAGLKFDLLYFLPDLLLAKVDIASMAVSLEARSPFLDHNMIDLAAKIPFNLKVKNGESKYILKKAMEVIVPKENLYRTKMGFTIPLHKWFKGDLNPYAKSVLLAKNSHIKELIDTDRVKEMLEDNNRTEDFGPRLWSLLSLELWFKAYFD